MIKELCKEKCSSKVNPSFYKLNIKVYGLASELVLNGLSGMLESE